MGRQLLKLSISSLKRRWRALTRACVTTFLALFFITGVLLFQENMYQWQMASNMERFGDWFVMDVASTEPSEYLMKHPYIQSYSVASYVMQVYEEPFGESITYMGYMSEDFIIKSHIKAEIGRMPQNKGEVAMDYDTLSKFGYKAEAGQNVTIYYKDGTQTVPKQYKLVGILRNYTSSWPDGDQLPGVIVTEEEARNFDEAIRNVYIYSMEDSVRTDNFRLIFDNMKENYGRTLIYNENVYDYKPWGLPLIYNYMYVLVMAIGITALTYQIITYRTSRQNYNVKLRRMGASRGQINIITYIENMLIIVPFGLLGVLVAGFIGKIICVWIEQKMQVYFYRINTEIFVKALISIFIAVVVEEIVSFIYTLRSKNARRPVAQVSKKRWDSPPKLKLNKNNFDYVVHMRFMKGNGMYQNIAIRLFSLIICVVILACIINIVTAQKAYTKNETIPDVIGYKQETDNFYYRYPMFIRTKNALVSAGPDNWEYVVGADYGDYEEEFNTFFGEDNIGAYEKVSYTALKIARSKYMKIGNTNLSKGYSQSFVNNLKTVNGIKNVSYSYFETQRMWSWDGMDFEKMGIDLLSASGEVSVDTYGDRYWYATNYISADKQIYNKLGKYIDKEYVDYDAFANGEQIIVFIDDNPHGEYDDTISVGEKISYKYYDVPMLYADNGNQNKVFSYNDAFEEFAIDKLYTKEKLQNWRTSRYSEDYEQGYVNADKELAKDWYQLNFGSCVEPTVAGVVRLTDEIKEEFKDLLVDYGYYTAIASTKLAETACDKQNELMADILGIEELPADAKCEPIYNQISIYYDLSSSYSATANIVNVYFKEANVKFISNIEEKETLRTKTISALLQYGITMFAAIVINVLIMAIVVKNRIAARRQKLRAMILMGANRSRLCRICMIEAVRESLWCVFTLPIVLLAEYMLYRKAIDRLELQDVDCDILTEPFIVVWLRRKRYELSLISADAYAAVGIVVVILMIVMIIPMISTRSIETENGLGDADYIALEVETDNGNDNQSEQETRKVVIEGPPKWTETYDEQRKLWVICMEQPVYEAGVTYVSTSSSSDQALYSWGRCDEDLERAIVDYKGGAEENLNKYAYRVQINVDKGSDYDNPKYVEAEYKRLKDQTDMNIHLGYHSNSTHPYTLFGELTLNQIRYFPANDEYTYTMYIMIEGGENNFASVDVLGLVEYETEDVAE